ncbi:hypothetical protein ACFFIR_08515, partial [Microbacterium arthrosphaerae]
DIDDPAARVARLEARARGEEPARDEMDDALARLLAGEVPAAAAEGDAPAPGASGEKPETEGDDSDDDGSGAPEDHRPV